jgi:3'-phosphoadenosine 5'-phosphosulfate sulfotransferase (PAPS reductase)/FAD synthetase
MQNPQQTERHVVALSGGKDSSALALLLVEREPRDYLFLCTPTGNEPDAMFAHWRKLGELLGSPVVPLMKPGGLKGCINEQKMLPNFRARFCTRILKIEPYRGWLVMNTPCTSYVGLRADEEGRAGGAYGDIPGVTMRFPLREWGMSEADVWAYLNARGVIIPRRTDCKWCYHQRIGEWYLFWSEDIEGWMEGEAIEAQWGATFRSPGRDTWPVSMKGLREAFEGGRIPKSVEREKNRHREAGACRVCTL